MKSAGASSRARREPARDRHGHAANDFHLIIPGDNDTLASFTSRGIRGSGDEKPDVTAVGETSSRSHGFRQWRRVGERTSMATPMVAGEAALIRSKNAGWTPEQVKADIMNTAGEDLYTDDNHSGPKYAPNRVAQAGSTRRRPSTTRCSPTSRTIRARSPLRSVRSQRPLR